MAIFRSIVRWRVAARYFKTDGTPSLFPWSESERDGEPGTPRCMLPGARWVKVELWLILIYVHYQRRARRASNEPRGKKSVLSPLSVVTEFCVAIFILRCRCFWRRLWSADSSGPSTRNLFHPAIPRPFILWMHASAFISWVIFFISQSALVRVHRVSWHRSIGWFVVLGSRR